MSFYTAVFDAIGVENQVTVVERAALPTALGLARSEVRALDDACSRFRTDSELALLNAAGHRTVSPLLLDAIGVALDAARSTDGLVDPTVGGTMRALGYDRDFEGVVRRGPAPRFELRPASGWRAVEVDRAASTVRLTRGELDLGATSKAYAADRIAAAIYERTGSSVLVSLGGDLAVAGPAPEGGWPILVTDDSRGTDARGQVVAIRAGGLATSSTTVRRWQAGEAELHHIVHPQTGLSAWETWSTVSVAAPTCLEANVAATAAIVAGPAGAAWLSARRYHARLVRPDGATATTGGWPVPMTARPSAGELRWAA